MTCKGAGGKKAKYMYYFCDNCNLYYNEAEIEDCLIDYILDLVEYDFHVNKYFYPLLAEKRDDETKEIEKEIQKLEQQKERLMKVYVNGILHEEDFAKDYEFIEKKLSELDSKKIEALNFDKETFNPIHLLAERDIEREKLTEYHMNNEQLQDYLSTLKKELDINYMDLGEYYFHDDKIDENYDNKSKVAMIRDRHIEFKLKKNQKVIRMVAIKQYKNFLAKPEGKLRLGLVTHTTSKKKRK